MTQMEIETVQKEILTEVSRDLKNKSVKLETIMAKLAMVCLPQIASRLKEARRQLESFEKKYKMDFYDFEHGGLDKKIKTKSGAEEHGDWIEWSYWNQTFNEALQKYNLLRSFANAEF